MSLKCPSDGTVLQMAERVGTEIDYCPECRGVWLGQGVLDRIIDRSGTSRGDQHSEHDHDHDHHKDHDRHGDNDQYDEDGGEHGDRRGRKRRGALSGLTGLFGGDED